MSFYWDCDYVASKNFAKYFIYQAYEERDHAEKLMKLQSQQGGWIFLQEVEKPDRHDRENGVNEMKCTLHSEQSMNSDY